MLVFFWSGGAAPPVEPPVVVVRGIEPQLAHNLGLALTDSKGRVTLLTSREKDPWNVPIDLEIANSDPGGFETASCSLLREIGLRRRRGLNLHDDVRAFGLGTDTAWEGRQHVFGQSSDLHESISVDAVGYSAKLDDDSYKAIFVDRDLSHWTNPPSLQRELNLLPASGNAYRLTGSTEVKFDPGGTLAVIQALEEFENINAATVDRYDLVESWYDAHGIDIGEVYHDTDTYDWNNGNSPSNLANPFVVQLLLSDDDVHSAVVTRTCREDQTPTGYLAAGASEAKWATLQLYYNAFIANIQGVWQARWRKLAVYGTHGLTRQSTGTDPITSVAYPGGFYLSDIIGYIIDTFTTLRRTSSSVRAADFIVPHSVFLERTPPREMIEFLNAYARYFYGCWEDQTFHYYDSSPDGSWDWEARLSDGARLKLTGEDSTSLFTGVRVIYSDFAGREAEVGPEDSSRLIDTDPANPLVAHGDTKYGLIKVDHPIDQLGAIQIGEIWLRDHSRITEKGQLTVPLFARRRSTGGLLPCWKMRSSEYVKVSDFDSTPRKIVRAKYSAGNKEVTLDLDNTPHTLDRILEVYGVSLVGVV